MLARQQVAAGVGAIRGSAGAIQRRRAVNGAYTRRPPQPRVNTLGWGGREHPGVDPGAARAAGEPARASPGSVLGAARPKRPQCPGGTRVWGGPPTLVIMAC